MRCCASIASCSCCAGFHVNVVCEAWEVVGGEFVAQGDLYVEDSFGVEFGCDGGLGAVICVEF